jgi:hypothetical protein
LPQIVFADCDGAVGEVDDHFISDMAESGNSFDANTYLLKGAKPARGQQKRHWAWTMKNTSGVAVNVGLSFDDFQAMAKQETNGRIEYGSGDCNGDSPVVADVRLKADDSQAGARMLLVPIHVVCAGVY